MERKPIFDYLRLFLASLVVYQHLAKEVTGNPAPWLPVAPVPCFLAISGWCVYQSYKRSTDGWEFWIKRFFRIMPPFLASLLMVRILFHWPAVKDCILAWATLGNQSSANPPLWSLGCEEIAYAALGLMLWAKVLNKRTSPWLAVGASILMIYGLKQGWNWMYISLVPAFFIGIWFSEHKVKVPWFVTLAALVGVMALKVPDTLPGIDMLLACLLILQLGILKFKKEIPDISYGVYIYHCPILVWLVEKGIWGSELITLTVGGALGVSLLSFILLERPAMALGRKIVDRRRKRLAPPEPLVLDPQPA